MHNTVKIVWEGDDESLLSQWFFEDGADVEKGDVLCELMQEKVAVEVEAPVSGKLNIIISEPDSEIAPGTLIGEISS